MKTILTFCFTTFLFLSVCFSQVFSYDFTEFTGTTTFFGPIVVERRVSPVYVLRKINLLGQEIDDYYSGVVIIQYSDGSIVKTIQ